MNSRERISSTLNHKTPDRVPLDLGGTPVTGMHASSVYLLRQALGLDAPGEPVKISNIYQMLGEIRPDLLEALGGDVVYLGPPGNSFGIKNEGWKEWKMFDGTPVLVPEGFNTEPEANGDILLYPEGDRSAPPSGRMPAGGYYFDALIRQSPLDEENLRVEDNVEEFKPLSAETLAYYEAESRRLYEQTDKAILANVGGTGFGDVAHLPGVQLRHPKGIRDIEEWYISLAARQDFVYQVFERQCEVALQNLAGLYSAAGERVQAVFLSGTDFGGQTRLIISPRIYRKLFKPFHQRLNDWIHSHTNWKTFIHTDGAIAPLLPDLIEAGFDILNPLQWTASGMDTAEIKARYGQKLTFWGGGIDTQKTLPFGTPEEVRQEVLHYTKLLKEGGGFVFSSVHNVQANVPVENILAMYEAFQQAAAYAQA
jgi:hypothetical protein